MECPKRNCFCGFPSCSLNFQSSSLTLFLSNLVSTWNIIYLIHKHSHTMSRFLCWGLEHFDKNLFQKSFLFFATQSSSGREKNIEEEGKTSLLKRELYSHIWDGGVENFAILFVSINNEEKRTKTKGVREIAKKIRRLHMTAKQVFNLNFFDFRFLCNLFFRKRLKDTKVFHVSWKF